jgi:hypothetical protein
MDGLGQEEWETKGFKSRFFHRASRCEPSLRRLILIRSECASSWGESLPARPFTMENSTPWQGAQNMGGEFASGPSRQRERKLCGSG